MYGFQSGGVLVSTVTPDGPAAKAGVKPMDVIVSIDGKPVKDGDALVADISSRKVGSNVQLGILRNGSKQNLSVGIADRAKLFADAGKPGEDTQNPTESDAGEGKLGITVTPVPSNLASKLGVKGGVVIASVRPGSFADEINLAKGAGDRGDQQACHYGRGELSLHREQPQVRRGRRVRGSCARRWR